ncbi:MAG TPA: type II toxin-antitoxin system ParD family antitoxin [Tepidisphaeraceae bacterium]|nr:type II toxin-antitoxin system ParD family antitoxin [Tepidisphaeraceae bacterium]
MANRTTINISLTPQLQQLMNEKLASGNYGSASELVRDGLRLIDQRDRLLAIEEMRAKIDAGWKQSEQGKGRDGERIFSQMRKQLVAKLSANKTTSTKKRKSA